VDIMVHIGSRQSGFTLGFFSGGVGAACSAGNRLNRWQSSRFAWAGPGVVGCNQNGIKVGSIQIRLWGEEPDKVVGESRPPRRRRRARPHRRVRGPPLPRARGRLAVLAAVLRGGVSRGLQAVSAGAGVLLPPYEDLVTIHCYGVLIGGKRTRGRRGNPWGPRGTPPRKNAAGARAAPPRARRRRPAEPPMRTPAPNGSNATIRMRF